jgi:ferric iron reductase protein FhuF
VRDAWNSLLAALLSLLALLLNEQVRDAWNKVRKGKPDKDGLAWEVYSVYLLYWYTSTNTDAEGGGVLSLLALLVQTDSPGRYTRFTCFTGTQVLALLVQILTQTGEREATALWRYSVYLLYWYKSTNTDAEGGGVLSLLALLVQKY